MVLALEDHKLGLNEVAERPWVKAKGSCYALDEGGDLVKVEPMDSPFAQKKTGKRELNTCRMESECKNVKVRARYAGFADSEEDDGFSRIAG